MEDDFQFRLDQSQGDAFTQIAKNVPANPEKSDALNELMKLRRASSDADRQMAAQALVRIAEKVRLDNLAEVAKSSDAFESGRRVV